MNRLINLRKTTQFSYKLLSQHNISDFNGISGRNFSSFDSCPCLCNQNNAVVQRKMFVSVFGTTTMHCTSVNTLSTDMMALDKAKKRKKKKLRKFTELLQVTSASTKETKTSVKNLKADKLHDFIISDGVTVSADVPQKKPSKKTPKSKKKDEYHKIDIQMLEHRDILQSRLMEDEPVIFVNDRIRQMKLSKRDLLTIMESFNTHKEVALAETGAHTFEEPLVGLAEHAQEEILELEEDVHLEPIVEEATVVVRQQEPLQKQGKTSKGASGTFKSKYFKTHEDQIRQRAKSLANSLYSYVELCIATGMINRGFSTILNYRYKYQQQSETKKMVLNIELYNMVLSGFAEKGNWQRTKEIMKILREDDVKYTPATYAYILECLGRLETTAEINSELQSVLNRTSTDGIDLNTIMDKTKFVNDKREIVLAAIQSVFSDFHPKYTPPHFYYENPLVDRLNEHVIPVDVEVGNELEVSGSEIMDPKRGFTKEDLMLYAKEQLEIEMSGYVSIKNISRKDEAVTPLTQKYREKWDDLNKLWHGQICSAFHRDLNSMRAQALSQNGRALNLFPYLKALDVSQFAHILLKEIRTLCEGSETYSPGMNMLHKDIGRRVQMHFQVEQKKRNGILEKMGEIYSSYCETIAEGNSSDNPRQLWQRLVYQQSNEGPSMDIVEKPWPLSAQIGVGKFLYNIMLRDLKIDTNCLRANAKTTNLLPAFYTLFRYHGHKVVQELKPHPVLIKLLRGSLQENLIFAANLVPMVCPPQPWSNQDNGGYLLMKSDFLRLPNQAVQQLERMKETNEENLYPAIDSLNQLASVPWKVNQDILDVMMEVFNNGGSEKLDVPQPPSALQTPAELLKNKSELTQEEKIKNFKLKLLHKRKQSEMYSLWCDALYRLSLANHFREKVFWLPHNLDFRGRAYPVPPHLNHLGSDLARSLLIFHKKKPLGVDGFAWLKLHCINLTGLKKRDSVRERLLYVEEIMEDILDSADNPLTGRMWWTKSDEPWQTLSACQEIAKVHRCENPETYMSCFPIHQDGSCNGLQHYAALGRDAAGAFSVNLVPSDVPQDVYSAVAVLVEEMRQKEAQAGNKIAQVLEGFIRRKVIKQTVMTTVYGVTRYGARLQIAKQLKDIDDFPQDFVWQASTYLTMKTFESLREMFTSTKEIQDWFTECARHISTTKGDNVEWCTPLGLPVVQPYCRYEKKVQSTKKLGGRTAMDMYEKPNIMKQKNAFPPNFIHSLDSSHMMLTSLHCERAGLTFISVHDCFWTHACTVPDMNKITREQFVALHSEPILEDLSKFMIDKYSYRQHDFAFDASVTDMAKAMLNKTLDKVPEKGDFDLRNVLNSVYFFS